LVNLKIIVNKAEGEKCARCWNYSENVGADDEYSDLCPRCAGIINSRPLKTT
jgi:isoleucyl-tRNA synthetase